MKKIIAAVILLALLLINLPKPLEKAVAKTGSVVTFHFYEQKEGTVFEGSTYRLTVNIGDAPAARRKTDGIAGTTIKFAADEREVQKVIKSLYATSVKREDTADAVIYAGRSPRLTGGVMTSNGKVNFQIAYSDGYITVGSPLILGSI